MSVSDALTRLVTTSNEITSAMLSKGVSVENLTEVAEAIKLMKATWGEISGNLADQTDLQELLDSKLTVNNSGEGVTTIDSDLNLTGEVSASSLTLTSDRNLKTDIEVYNVTETVLVPNFQAYKYTLTTDGKKHVGLIAQEIQELIPEAVHEFNGHLVIDYSTVTAVLASYVSKISLAMVNLTTQVKNIEYKLEQGSDV